MGRPFPFLLAHWRAHWRLLTTAGAGFLVVAWLLASSPLYLAVVEEASLRFEMEQQALENLDIQLVVPFRPMDRQTHQRMDQLVQKQVDEDIGWMTRAVVQYGSTPEFFLIPPGLPLEVTASTPRTTLQFLSGLEEHVSLVEGRWWQRDGGVGGDGNAEAVIGAEAAAAVGLTVGDRIVVIPQADDVSRRATLTVVGTVELVNDQDEYWLGYDRFSAIFPGLLIPPTIPLFADPQAFLDTLGKALAPQTATYWWFMYITKSSLTTETLATAASGVEEMENEVSSAFPRATALTALDMAIARHQARLLFTSAPLRLLLVFTLGVAVLYLLVVGAILVERQRQELTLLRSRGASIYHLLTPLALEAVALALLSLLVAPFLASLTLSWRLVAPLEALTGTDLPGVLPGGSSYLLAGGGMVVVLVALLAPAFGLSRLTGMRLRQAMSRPQGSLLVFRLYLDIFLLVVGGILWWEFTRSDTGVTRSLLGPPAENPLLVVAPFLLLVGLVLLFLRLLPLVARIAGVLLTPVVPAWASLGLWMLGRHPATPVRLTLLVAVASGATVLAAAVMPTLASAISNPAAPSQSSLPDPVLAISLGVLAQLTVPALVLMTTLGAMLIGQVVLQERFAQVGVLQALGMSHRELARWLVLEHLLLLTAALGLGVWLGHQLSLQVLPLLDVGVRNPFIPEISGVETEWLVVGGFALLATVALLVTLTVTLGVLHRSALKVGLRVGEEV